MTRYLIPLILCLPALLLADSRIASFDNRGLRMICGESLRGIHCTIRKRRLKVLNVFALENPTRLVVDVSRMPKGKSKFIKASRDTALEQIRTGWHPEKYRIVFDIDSELSTYSWEKYGDVVRLSFATASRKPEAILAKTNETAIEDSIAPDKAEPIQVAKLDPETAVATEQTDLEEVTGQRPPKINKEPVVRAQLRHPPDSFNRKVVPDEAAIIPTKPATTTSMAQPIAEANSEPPSTIIPDFEPDRQKMPLATKIASPVTEAARRSALPELHSGEHTPERKKPPVALAKPKLAAAIKIEPQRAPGQTELVSENAEPAFSSDDNEEKDLKTARIGILRSNLAPVKTIRVATMLKDSAEKQEIQTERVYPQRSNVRMATRTVSPDIRAELFEEISATLPPSSFKKRNTPPESTTTAVAPTTTREDQPEAPAMISVTSSANPVRARLSPEHIPVAPQDDVELQKGQFMRGIRFIHSEDDAAEAEIELLLTKKPHFNLSKVGPRTYRLRIMKASVASDSLLLPFFPPHTFPKISFVQARNERDRVSVTIGVERGTRLLAVSKENSLFVTVLQ